MTEVRTTSSTGGQKGVKIARFDLIPPNALRALAEHFGRGARKYDDSQWRKGYEWSKSYAALQRHLGDFWAGKDYDVCSNDPDGCSMVDAEGLPHEPLEPDTCFNHTGSHHLDAAMWHSFVLRTFVDEHPDHDDRYRAAESEIGVDIAQPDVYPSVAFAMLRQFRDLGLIGEAPEAVEASAGESPLHENQSRGTFHLAEERTEDAEVAWQAHLAELRDATKDSHPL